MKTPKNITSSQLFVQAAGMKPFGDALNEDTACALCSADLKAGDLALPMADRIGDSFNNRPDMKRRSGFICGCCQTLFSISVLTHGGSTLFNKEGVFNLKKLTNAVALLLTPPEVPFAACISTRKSQHILWRVEVTHDPKFISVTINSDCVTVDVELAKKAVGAWNHIRSRLKASKIKREPGPLQSRFTFCGMGMLYTDVHEAMTHDAITNSETQQALETLQSLRTGEWWGLSVLKDVDLDTPEGWPTHEHLDQQKMSELVSGEIVKAKDEEETEEVQE